MNCPICNSKKTKVRWTENKGLLVKRCRECVSCETVFQTYEDLFGIVEKNKKNNLSLSESNNCKQIDLWVN
ncbi:MAG: hypothetical protein HQK79_20685 [Desulfobacterales bacterium]|nr:hypothetical protein [Desulfobacterales bacterium]MBF0398660.1 hypothetical protein [Desulfobacterales bacterium]